MEHFKEHFEHKLTVYRQAMIHAGIDSIVIYSGRATTVFQDDLDYPFKANAYFKEWFAIGANQNAFLWISLDAKPIIYIHRPADYWHSSPALPTESVTKYFDVIEYQECAQLDTPGRTVYIGEVGVNSNQYLNPRDASSVTENDDMLLHYIDYHRAWKSEYELNQLRAANRLAVQGHNAAKLAFYAGKSELEIHLAYLHAIVAKDSELPYDSIVGLNHNAAVLHHMLLSDQRPAENLSLLIDAGAVYAGYAADISRSYPARALRDAAPERQQGLELYTQLCESVDRAQLELVGLVTENRDYVDIHIQSHRLMAEILADLKVVNCDAQEAFESGLSRVFLPHGVGHLLGVQVHDRGGHMANSDGKSKPPPSEYPALRCTRVIEENMVFTIEPGIYFIPQLLQAWDKPELLNQKVIDQLLPFGGVRVEDNVVAAKGTPENMTRDAFNQLS